MRTKARVLKRQHSEYQSYWIIWLCTFCYNGTKKPEKICKKKLQTKSIKHNFKDIIKYIFHFVLDGNWGRSLQNYNFIPDNKTMSRFTTDALEREGTCRVYSYIIWYGPHLVRLPLTFACKYFPIFSQKLQV